MVAFAKRITSSNVFQGLIIFLILLTGSLSGVESYLGAEASSPALRTIARTQDVILWVFVLEIALKIVACGKRPWHFFQNAWNLFDFLIVGVCIVSLDAQFGTVLRMARLVRTLRLVTVLPRLQLLVSALLKSIPSLGYIGVLLGLHVYMYAVIGTFVFRHNDPLRFGSLHESVLTLFQVLTLEGWNDIMATQYLGSEAAYDDSWKVLSEGARVSAPQPVVATVYFVSFIMLGTMIMLNLFTGVIVASMEEASNEAAEAKRKRHVEQRGSSSLRDELAQIGRQMSELSTRLEVIQQSELPSLGAKPAPDVLL